MTRRRAEPRCLAFVFAAWAALSHAQGGGAVVPRLSVTQTWTDNLYFAEKDKDAALITMVSPGISLVSNSGAVHGSLDYSLNGIYYVKTDQPSRVSNSLAANGRVDVLPGTLLVNVAASVGQQNASAFGQQSVPSQGGGQGLLSNLASVNQHETAALAVSPQLHGKLGGMATYDLRGDFARTEARGTSLGDSQSRGASLNISQSNVTLLGAWLTLGTQRNSSNTSKNAASNLSAGLNFLPDPDWRFSANVGMERTDYLGGDARSSTTKGVSADWSPSSRTRVGANWQGHAYGDSHTVTLVHRMSRSVWNYADSRSTTLGNVGANGGVGTYYNQFFQLFASQEPDLIKRDVLVRDYLRSQGLSPDAPVAGGFLSGGPSRTRSQLLGIALQGVQSSLSVNFSRMLTNRLGDNQYEGSLASSSRIQQRSVAVTGSHQLSSRSGLSLSVMRQQTSGELSSQSTHLTSVMANWNMRLGTRMGAQLGVRHNRFEGVTPYTENGANANLTVSF